MRLADHSAGGDVQGREQRRGAAAFVVVGTSLWKSWREGKQRLRTVEGLDLALFVHAQHHRHLWRLHVQPDDVAHLLDEHGVGGEFEGLLPVRLQPERSPNARDRRLRQPRLTGHAARAPMRGAPGHAPQRLGDHSIDTGVVNRSRSA
jgi:hypothetical protein